MQNLLVQVSNKYLCLTACEPVGGDETNGKKKIKVTNMGPEEKRAYSFSSPYFVSLDKEVLQEHETIWEDPVMFARLISDGLSQMNHSEVKHVILLLDNFDLTTQEYQHFNGQKKILDNQAIDQIRSFVGERVSDFSIIYKDYAEVKDKKASEEVTAKAFAIPRALIDDLSAALKSFSLELIKAVPVEVAMLYAAQNTVYSFNKTIALVSMDFCSVRVLIAQNGETLYCHDFHSPVPDILSVIEEDRDMSTAAAVDYFRTIGYGLLEDCRTPKAQRQIEEIRDGIVDEIVKNIRLVVMSLNIQIDQMFLSDYIAYVPHIRNFFTSFGLCKDIQLISDTFNNSTIMPEPSLKARDDFYKSGSFFVYNELMNSGAAFEDNLVYGLKATVAKTLDVGNKVAKFGIYVLGALIIVGLGSFTFFKVRENLDNKHLEDTKYDTAKELITKHEELEDLVNNQSTDMDTLPRTKFYTEDVINQLDAQVVANVNNFQQYSIKHTVDGSTESYNIPISGSISTFNNFVELQNNINSNGFFSMNPVFTISDDTENGGYNFSTTLSAEGTSASKTTTDKDSSDTSSTEETTESK
jgi:hypothetical protein